MECSQSCRVALENPTALPAVEIQDCRDGMFSFFMCQQTSLHGDYRDEFASLHDVPALAVFVDVVGFTGAGHLPGLGFTVNAMPAATAPALDLENIPVRSRADIRAKRQR